MHAQSTQKWSWRGRGKYRERTYASFMQHSFSAIYRSWERFVIEIINKYQQHSNRPPAKDYYRCTPTHHATWDSFQTIPQAKNTWKRISIQILRNDANNRRMRCFFLFHLNRSVQQDETHYSETFQEFFQFLISILSFTSFSLLLHNSLRLSSRLKWITNRQL